MPLKIAFTHKTQESIFPGMKKNFLRMFKFFSSSGFSTHSLEESEEFSQYAMIVVGTPESPFSKNMVQKLRNYVLEGGKLFVLLKWGGDAHTNRKGPSNIGEIFDDIQPNNDIVLENGLHQHLGIDHLKKYQPIVQSVFEFHGIKFSGDFIYDGGCTFSAAKSDKGFNIDAGGSLMVGNSPRWSGSRYSYQSIGAGKPVIVYREKGKGAVLYCGSRWMFSDQMIDEKDNSVLFRQLMVILLGQQSFEKNVEARMDRVQRHRLLHGFPMPDANKFSRECLADDLGKLDMLQTKKLAVGVICHPMCNPSVRGCGYCTFPHKRGRPTELQNAVQSLIREIDALQEKYPALLGREVSSIYLGGGTANLTPPPVFREMCEKLKNHFKITKDTEITLEGAPAYFVDGDKKELLAIMRDVFGDADLRISMGIQTFDEEIMALMGRTRMNRTGSVEEALKITRNLGIRSSADFMFNLPGRGNWDAIQKDLDKAVDLGIEHICWYNLVADPAVGSKWSQDQEIQRVLPGLEQSLDNWLRLYEALREKGYKASTLTDFELEKGNKGHYQYEIDLRNPQDVDWLGVGSYAISLFSNADFTKAFKYINPEGLSSYIDRQRICNIPWKSKFEYTQHDLKIFWLTRQIKGTSIAKKSYQALFNSTLEADFPLEIKALLGKGLLEDTGDELKVTPKGFFYADTISGHFAWMRVNELILRNSAGRVVKRKASGQTIEYNRSGGYWYNDAVRNFMG